MKCPITEIKSVHKESSPNYTNLLINNVFYALSLPRSIGDYIVQAINSHKKLVTVMEEAKRLCQESMAYESAAKVLEQALEAEKKE